MIFRKTKEKKIVKVSDGILTGKYVMVVKEWDDGVSVVPEATEWPAEVNPNEFNAIFVSTRAFIEIPLEEQTLLGVKFPDASQYE